MKSNAISVMGHGPFGAELCEALGLDLKGVVSIDFHIKTQEIVTVIVEQHLRGDAANKMFNLLRRYELVEKESEYEEIEAPTGLVMP